MREGGEYLSCKHKGLFGSINYFLISFFCFHIVLTRNKVKIR